MDGRRKLWSIIFCLVALFMGGGVVCAAVSRTAWLGSSEPVIEKIADLPANQEPVSLSQDCTLMQLPNGLEACAYKTPLGTMAGGMLLDGSKGAYPYDPSYGGYILPSVPNNPGLLVTSVVPRSWITGDVMIRTGTYDSAQLKYAEYYGGKKVYEYYGQPGTVIRAPNETNALPFNSTDVAYSADGEWIAAIVRGKGIYRYSLTTQAAKLVAWDADGYSHGGFRRTNNVAISEDGRFIAVTMTVPNSNGTRPSLRVYDAETCRDQYANFLEPTKHNGCEYKDYWTGEYRTGNSRGIRDVLPTAEYPRRVRFIASDTLTFDTIYDRTSSSVFKVARYSLRVASSTNREYVGVLGMGDSYISGEGAYSYRAGTDTKSNKCHTSWRSYPYLLGRQEFTLDMTKSVACSGAKMLDVAVESGDPEPDPKKKITSEDFYKGQSKIKDWGSRTNRESIISGFSVGYANQTIFAREYKPRAVLLSIGGNDVGFKDILVTCIDVGLPDTCYHYYEDRLQVMQQVLSQYDRLVKTYKKVLADSGGRLYVAGYPQVAKVGGACRPNVQLNGDEIKFSTQLITYLNSVIKRAAAEAGAYYVDTEDALTGHRLCEAAAEQSGVNGIVKGDDIGLTNVQFALGGKLVRLAIGNESYHPTQRGHKLLNQAVLSKTSNLTAVMPKPVANNKPALDYSSALLQNVPHAPEQQRHTEAIKWVNDSDVPPMLLGGNTYTTNISGGALKTGTNMQIVLHSEPVKLYDGKYDPSTPAMFSVPSDTAPGFHTLDVYGTDAVGQPVDLREVVYVAMSIEDYDGDGSVNAVDPCPISQQSNLDEDSDGVDDACDGEVLPASLIQPDEVPESSAPPLDLDSDGSNADVYASSLLAPYVPPKADEPVADEDANPPKESIATPENPTTVSTAQGVVNKTLPLDFGFVLTPVAIEPVQTAGVARPATVLGSDTKLAKNSPQDPKKGEQRTFLWQLLMGVLAASILAVKFFRSRNS